MINYINKKVYSLLKNTVLGIFKFSKVPESVAFIMDGNRRYAKNKGMEKIKGHHEGFDKLIQVMEWCLILRIKVVTVYALSIDNFNRPKEELDGLMELVEEKFSKLSEKNALFQQQGIKVQFLGNLEFVDKKIRDIVDKMVEDTKHNSKLVLNVCFSYNFNDEFDRALTLYHENKSQRYKDSLEESKIESELQKIIENFEKCLYGENNIAIDILIRTSGEVRLSNFCLYQCRFSMLCFVNKLWPDFSLMDFLKILLRYQIDYPTRFQNLEELSLKNQFKINK